MDGSGRLSYNHEPFRFTTLDDRPEPSNLAPPGGVGFRRAPPGGVSFLRGIGREPEAYFFDKDSPNLNRAEIYGITGDVYIGGFRNNVFHGSGVYQFEDPVSGCTAGYFAFWESGKRVGGEPKVWHMG